MIDVDLTRAGGATDRYAAAIAELPLTARAWRDPRGVGSSEAGGRRTADAPAAPASSPAALGAERTARVRVVSGASGWLERAGAIQRDSAAQAGHGPDSREPGSATVASAPTPIVIAEPEAIAPGGLSFARAGAAMIVERSRMPELPDAARAAAAAARTVVIEAALPTIGGEEWLRDAIGWARLLAGLLEVESCAHAGPALLASFRGRDGIPVSLIAHPTSGPPRIDAHALGEARVAARVDDAGVEVRVASDLGDLLLAADLASPARRALHRATAGNDDLPDLIHDERIRARLDEE